MEKISDTNSILRIFSARMKAELEHQKVETKIQVYSWELEKSNKAIENFSSIASHD